MGNHTLAVQVSAVNRKTLDLTVKLPPAWAAFEVVVEVIALLAVHAVSGE